MPYMFMGQAQVSGQKDAAKVRRRTGKSTLSKVHKACQYGLT